MLASFPVVQVCRIYRNKLGTKVMLTALFIYLHGWHRPIAHIIGVSRRTQKYLTMTHHKVGVA